ncbi:MFS transporter [Pectobacteriaceae bacterium CE70]|uniref:MFS transporter n=1 Tax=Serratia sp. (strain ATCC 39006) TaxID=104623 RepID=A0A2I5T2R1_SERS3|nr:MFS transporter [Serratia sp. ATCC 39006]WJV62507.1 MFS transporter [Pectobacteriaceae bacterium C52]WJV66821.1 MFS transporter [Pectobacteriaceae bacterium CE70]WJY10814.1 MFS transporter [Pectobacteriaceae bacterium C80]AUG98867.1 MFS transporter [Serratia sp. ATCC 39006]AUH03182.1 MFS transporter [Serratia sp. ATCC 39006]
MKLPKIPLLAQISSAHWVSHFHMMVLPALMPLISTQRGISFVEIGFALGVFNVVSACVQTPTGFVVDRIGARRTLIAGLTLGSLCFLSLGFFTSYTWMLAAMALAGVANAVYHPSDYALLSRGIDETRMGRAFSIHTFSGFLGTAVAPGVLLAMASLTGIESAFITAGLLSLATIPLLLTEHETPVRTVAKRVETKSSCIRVFTLPIMTLLLLFMLLNLSTNSIQNFSVTALVTGYGLPLSKANMALTAFLFASAFGVLAGGSLADKTQHHGLVATGALAITACLVAIVATYSLPATVLIPLLGVAGFLSGMIAPSRDMLVRAASPAGAEGRVFGIVTTGFNIGGAGGPVVFGWLLDQGHPHAIFWSAVIFMIITAIMTLMQELHSAKQRSLTAL